MAMFVVIEIIDETIEKACFVIRVCVVEMVWSSIAPSNRQ